MSNLEPVNTGRLVKRVLLATVFIVLAGAFGLYVGQLSVPDDLPEYDGIGPTGKRAARPAGTCNISAGARR